MGIFKEKYCVDLDWSSWVAVIMDHSISSEMFFSNLKGRDSHIKGN